MRRPAQQPYGPTARTAWAHPYRGIRGLEVFYNDGGQGGAPAGAPTPPTPPAPPSPADLAARAGQQPPAVQPQPANPDDAVLLDHGTNAPMTQGAFTKIMARENAKGRRAALREIAEAAGIPFSPDDFDISKFGQAFKAAEQARQERLTDEQKRQEELAAKEQALQAREDAAAQREKDAAARDRTSRIRATLVSLGATGDDLEDAAALIRVADDADDAAIQEAADKLKERRGELFGTAPAPQTLPPAPSGGPAAGGAPRPNVPGRDAVKERARKMAIDRGLRQAS